MKPKIYYMGTQLRTRNGRFSSLKVKARRIVHIVKLATIGMVIIAASAGIGAVAFSTSTVTADTVTIQTPAPDAPILDRIAKCESGNTQYSRSGQVLIKPNTNGTVDIGKYQINSVWFAQATAMHLDLTREADNKAFAQWLYANKGTGDWASSQKCWKN